MRRVATWLLALTGVVAAAVGLVVWDASSRAVRAIEAEEARLRADLADYRTHRPFALPPAVVFESGHSGQRVPPMPHLEVLAALELGLESLGSIDQSPYEGGYALSWARRVHSLRALEDVRKSLRQPASPAELRHALQVLDRLFPRRPDPTEVIEGEHLLDRAELLGALAGRIGGNLLVNDPGWKEFFSWKVLVVKSLRQLEERKQELLRLKSDSLPTWEREALSFGLKLRHDEAYTRSRLCFDAGSILQSERQSRLHWTFTRIAVSISLYRAERGRFPETLADLGEVPLSPYDGMPFHYHPALLQTSPTSLGPQLEWDAGR